MNQLGKVPKDHGQLPVEGRWSQDYPDFGKVIIIIYQILKIL